MILVLATVVASPALFAQAAAPGQPAPATSCLPSATLEQLPKALDDAVSGPGDKDRTCLRQLVASLATLTLVTGEKRRYLTLEDWLAAMQKRGSVAMYERQVLVRTESFGHMAHLWSTYEISPTPGGKAIARGINSIQAVFDGKRWWVTGVLWQAEAPTEPIPEKYLP